ncbi:hypothetical protein FE257_011379 [Aspergillus nanangensis]|uniref:Uncharacterized protein n=1 Tax=Aspergillus nanangensis TaxID=2582783 RepID=A0AAD4CIZ7_ASPNN|nr:hypothetical protein FE257_011379 [Aspergillus nanangensis]
MFCLYGDRSRNIAIERLETEKPRLVRVRTLSRGNDDARVSLPQSVHSQLDIRESFAGKKSHTSHSGIEGSRARQGAASLKSRLNPKTLFSRRGILKSPTPKFPYEEIPPLEPWIVMRHTQVSRRVEVGRLPESENSLASDVVKIHAYRRRGDMDFDLCPDIIIEEVKGSQPGDGTGTGHKVRGIPL